MSLNNKGFAATLASDACKFFKGAINDGAKEVLGCTLATIIEVIEKAIGYKFGKIAQNIRTSIGCTLNSTETNQLDEE